MGLVTVLSTIVGTVSRACTGSRCELQWLRARAAELVHWLREADSWCVFDNIASGWRDDRLSREGQVRRRGWRPQRAWPGASPHDGIAFNNSAAFRLVADPPTIVLADVRLP